MTTYDESAQQVTAPAQRRRRKGGGVLGWLLVLLLLAAMGLALGAAALLWGERSYAGRIYPHISVRGLDLSAFSEPQARAALERRYSAFQSQPVLLSYGDRRWKPSAADLGLKLDFDLALRDAAAAGRESDRMENARTVQAIWEQGVDLPLRLQVDEAAIQRYVLSLVPALESAPLNADMQLVGATVQIFPDRDGTQLLVDETVHDIVAAIQSLSPQQVALRTRTLEAAQRSSDFAMVAAETRALLQGPLTLTDGQQQWVWSPEQIARWIRLRPSVFNGRATKAVSLEQDPIRRDLVPIAEALRQRSGLPRVDWNNGDLRVIEAAGPDHGLDALAAMSMILESVRGTNRTIALPIIELPPSIDQTNLASLGITTEIGRGVSSFSKSQSYRITNIKAGARRMHGLLVPPGATFSFNDNLGAVDASNGFVEGSAIVDNRTQKEWGGGLCQVSTTMFRAAFWSGMPIAERHEHIFRIGWYEELGEPPGLDAAIFTGISDMKFTNDTGGWILIQSEVDLQRQRLSIVFYGAPTGRTVTMAHRVLGTTAAPRKPVYITDPALPRSGYKKTDFARPGLKVEVYRTIREGSSAARTDTFPTEFKAWPNIYVRGGK